MTGSKYLSSSKNIHDFNENEIQVIADRAFGENAKVISHKLELFSQERLGYLGNHFYLYITVQIHNEQVTKKFFVKGVPKTADKDELKFINDSGVYVKEIEFFNEVLPKLEKFCPGGKIFAARCYYANDVNIVLEDLTEKGFSIPRNKLLDKVQLEAAVKAMARLHAASILCEANLGRPLNELYPNACKEAYFTPLILKYNVDKIIVDLAVRIAVQHNFPYNRLASGFTKIYNNINEQSGKNRVISHSDSWANNIMLNKDSLPEAILVDFQLTRYVKNAYDLASIIYTNTTKAMRENCESEILKAYYKEYQKVIADNNPDLDCLSYEELIEEYEECRLFGQILCVLYFPLTQLPNDENIEDNKMKVINRTNNDVVFELMVKNEKYRNIVTEAGLEYVKICEKLNLPEDNDTEITRL